LTSCPLVSGLVFGSVWCAQLRGGRGVWSIRGMSGSAGLPTSEELAALPVPVLVAQLLAALELVEQLRVRVEQLERQVRRDSSNSSKPPSSDPAHAKQPPSSSPPPSTGRRDRSLRQRSGRGPGKQPGVPGSTMRLVGDPDERVACSPSACSDCERDLGGVPVSAQQRHQVTDVVAPPPPTVTEYLLQTKVCPGCGASSVGDLPAGAGARAQYGPEVHAQAANLVCGQYLPVARAARLLGQMAGLEPSTGWMAGVRAKTAWLIEASGFCDRVRDLLRSAPALHADETPARVNCGTRHVHVACTRYLTLLHSGSRSADDIDAGGVLPGYDGVIVRDGYAGYTHLTSALHAWCAAHLLRDLKDLYDFEPDRQAWASEMAVLLIDARDAAAAARAQSKTTLDEPILAGLTGRYRALVARGLADNERRQTATAADARRLARRFARSQDVILRFVTHPDLDIFTNNEAERTIRPVKVQMRASGGCWRTLHGLAEFAIVQSYLSTATKWGIDKLTALRDLFAGTPWFPPGLTPT
jgi:transposase